MEFKNTKVSDDLLPEGVSQLYQGHVVKADGADTETLAARVASRLRIDVILARNIIAAYGEEILKAIARGERPIMEGVFTTRFTCEGSFDSEDAPWDDGRNAVGIAFITQDPVKSAVSGLVPTNTLGKVTVKLLGAQDATTYEQNTLVIGHTLLCQGTNVKLPGTNADEGLYLIKGSTGTEYKATVSASTAGTVDATFASTIPVGEDYRLEIRGRGGNGTNRSLVTASIGNFVVKAA